VFLDYARKRVIFEPTAETDKPFPERQTYGLSLLASEPDLHTYTVAAVRPNSPAEQDGFHKGDVITSLDGKPAAQILLSQIRQQLTHASERHRVVIQRGKDTTTLDIQVRLVSLDK
jgi:S1-C subfamily serine protease